MTVAASPTQLLPPAVPGMSRAARRQEKKRILDEYQMTFGIPGVNPPSIVTCKKGKIQPADQALITVRAMRPELGKGYRVGDLNLHHVIAIVVLQKFQSFQAEDIHQMRLVNKTFADALPKIIRWRSLDFSTLREPRLNYEDQMSIDPHRVEMANAAMLHFGLHPGKFVRWMGGEYVGQHRDVPRILGAVQPHISIEDFAHVRRILLQGCPHKLQFEESYASKHEIINRGNQKNFIDNPEIVRKTINKEDRYSHLIPMDPVLCHLSPYLRHTSQGIILKEGKSPRVVWDGSTKRTPMDTVLNDITSVADEAEITFGDTKMRFYTDVYNLRISHPLEPILLALADVKACFRFGRIHPDLTGAFGFCADEYYCLATAMVFGSNTSATSWEPFRCSIEALSSHYMNHPDLVDKHRRFLDMVRWEPNNPPGKPVMAKPCSINKGVLDTTTNLPIPRPIRMFVDDALIAEIGKRLMELRLAATIEAIFYRYGRRQPSPAAMPGSYGQMGNSQY